VPSPVLVLGIQTRWRDWSNDHCLDLPTSKRAWRWKLFPDNVYHRGISHDHKRSKGIPRVEKQLCCTAKSLCPSSKSHIVIRSFAVLRHRSDSCEREGERQHLRWDCSHRNLSTTLYCFFTGEFS
jgi:hypothetical protein